MFTSIDNPTIFAAIAGAVIGAVLSAILTNLVRSFLDRQSRIKDTRELLAEDAMVIVSEHSASLLEYYVARKSGEIDQIMRADAAVGRSVGKLMRLQIRIWKLFPEWYVTSAITKLIGRVNVVYRYFRYLRQTDAEAEIAMSWLHEMENTLMTHMSDAASIIMHRPAKIGFLGFNKKTRQRRLDVKNQEEDDPPPWECLVKFQFRDSRLSAEEIEQGESRYRKMLEKLRCKEHGYAAHVRMIGASDNFTLQMEVCCNNFADIVRSTIKTNDNKLV